MPSSSDQADLPVSSPGYEVLRQLAVLDYDPEIRARRQDLIEALLTRTPWLKPVLGEMILERYLEDRLEVARAALRQVLARRDITPSKDDDARIAACTEFAALWRWLFQAYRAASVFEALS
jgi:hypothetical protein